MIDMTMLHQMSFTDISKALITTTFKASEVLSSSDAAFISQKIAFLKLRRVKTAV
jgi:hypothetical protein